MDVQLDFDAEMSKHKGRNLRRLSFDFCKAMRRDVAKRLIIMPKIILEGLCLWPGRNNWAMKSVNYAIVISFIIMEISQVVYLTTVITDVTKVSSSFTTVSSVLQSSCKVMTMCYYKKTFNEILSKLWDDFWPVNIADKDTQSTIKWNMLFYKFFCTFYLCLALFSVTQFNALPFVMGNEMLPLPSVFPFDHTKVPYFEILYVWDYFINYIVVITLSGYDFFFCVIVMNVVSQLQILQSVLRSIHVSSTDNNPNIYKKFRVTMRDGKTTERQLFMKCVDHHMQLLLLCGKLEKCFSFVIFIQFLVSSAALCVSCLVLMVDPSLVVNMFTYAAAHLLQLFLVSSAGNELTYQSLQVGDAAAECGYQYNYDKDIRHGLLMMLQRSQRPMKLTALGFTELSYTSFLTLLRMSFSFYTMLDSFK